MFVWMWFHSHKARKWRQAGLNGRRVSLVCKLGKSDYRRRCHSIRPSVRPASSVARVSEKCNKHVVDLLDFEPAQIAEPDNEGHLSLPRFR